MAEMAEIFRCFLNFCVKNTIFAENKIDMIRTLKYLGIVVLLALTACNSYEKDYEKADAVLQEAERLYQHPQGERADYLGADTVQISQELANAAEFFVRREDFGKAALAALYSGYAQKEDDDKILATKYFKDAELYGTIAGDSLTMARAKFNIARMLYNERAYKDLIDIATTACQMCGNHNIEMAFLNNLIASSYILQKDYPSAKTYLDKSLTYAKEGKSTRATINVLNNYSVFYREQGKYDDAINCLLQMREFINDSIQQLMFYMNIGTIYVYNNEYNTADIYIQKALDLSTVVVIEPETTAMIYFLISYIKEQQGLLESSLDYYKKYSTLQYKIQKESEKKNLYSINRQYDYEILQNTMNKQIIGRQRIILIISLLLLLVAIVMIVSLVRQKNILKENKEIKQELDKTKEKLQKSVRSEVVEEELSRQLHLIITANRIDEHANDFKNEWAPLVRKINNEKDSMFEGAAAAVERVYPDMYSTILQKYPNLNDTESKVLLLSCSDLTNTEIGYILGLSVHSVNKSRSEIRRKIVV